MSTRRADASTTARGGGIGQCCRRPEPLSSSRRPAMNSLVRQRWPAAALSLVLLFATGFFVVQADVLGMGERLDRWSRLVANWIDPPPDRPTLPTVVVTPDPTASP